MLTTEEVMFAHHPSFAEQATHIDLSGLPMCRRKCETTDGCGVFAYNEKYMTACLLLGDFNLDLLKTNCRYALYDPAGTLDANTTHGNHTLTNAIGGVISESEVALIEGFFIYIIKSYPGQLYGAHEAKDATCLCKDGYKRMPSVTKDGMNEFACTPMDEPACTEVVVTGPVSLSEPSAQWPRKEEPTYTLEEQLHAAFEGCYIFWDCNGNGVKDAVELDCVVGKHGDCVIRETIYDVDACTPYYSSLAQSGRNCNAHLMIRSGDDVTALNVEYSSMTTSPCPGTPIVLEDPPTDTPTDHPTLSPTDIPTASPTHSPTDSPTGAPTAAPTPTEKPTAAPTTEPTAAPTNTHAPTDIPTALPTAEPTWWVKPTMVPTIYPTYAPSTEPTEFPTDEPTEGPTATPTSEPTQLPTDVPRTACDLCGQRSCRSIEVLGFDRDDLTDHQSTDIAFGFDKGIIPGSHRDTVADTLGACIFCEIGNSSDPDQCVFTEPKKIVEHWPVCDPLCGWAKCEVIEDMVSEHFAKQYGVPEADMSKYLERFMIPLCYACPVTDLCHHYGVPGIYNGTVEAKAGEKEEEEGKEGDFGFRGGGDEGGETKEEKEESEEAEEDTDGDGVVDIDDGCPSDPLKIEPGVCGCGVPDSKAPDCPAPAAVTYATAGNDKFVDGSYAGSYAGSNVPPAIAVATTAATAIAATIGSNVPPAVAATTAAPTAAVVAAAGSDVPPAVAPVANPSPLRRGVVAIEATTAAGSDVPPAVAPVANLSPFRRGVVSIEATTATGSDVPPAPVLNAAVDQIMAALQHALPEAEVADPDSGSYPAAPDMTATTASTPSENSVSSSAATSAGSPVIDTGAFSSTANALIEEMKRSTPSNELKATEGSYKQEAAAVLEATTHHALVRSKEMVLVAAVAGFFLTFVAVAWRIRSQTPTLRVSQQMALTPIVETVTCVSPWHQPTYI
jgi:hypothetical protein